MNRNVGKEEWKTYRNQKYKNKQILSPNWVVSSFLPAEMKPYVTFRTKVQQQPSRPRLKKYNFLNLHNTKAIILGSQRELCPPSLPEKFRAILIPHSRQKEVLQSWFNETKMQKNRHSRSQKCCLESNNLRWKEINICMKCQKERIIFKTLTETQCLRLSLSGLRPVEDRMLVKVFY